MLSSMSIPLKPAAGRRREKANQLQESQQSRQNQRALISADEEMISSSQSALRSPSFPYSSTASLRGGDDEEEDRSGSRLYWLFLCL